MLTGPDLGKALKVAMTAKGVVQREVAAEFGITQPSVSEWVKHGRIDKAHINHLVAYFSDVVRPSHWGLPDEWGSMPPATLPAAQSEAQQVAERFEKLNPEQRRSILALLSVYQPIIGIETAAAEAAVREPKPAPPPVSTPPGEKSPAAPSATRAR